MTFQPYAVDFFTIMTCIFVLVGLIGPFAAVTEKSIMLVLDAQDRIWERRARMRFHQKSVLRAMAKERRDEKRSDRDRFAEELRIET
jgi:hypothetical protein